MDLNDNAQTNGTRNHRSVKYISKLQAERTDEN